MSKSSLWHVENIVELLKAVCDTINAEKKNINKNILSKTFSTIVKEKITREKRRPFRRIPIISISNGCRKMSS